MSYFHNLYCIFLYLIFFVLLLVPLLSSTRFIYLVYKKQKILISFKHCCLILGGLSQTNRHSYAIHALVYIFNRSKLPYMISTNNVDML